MNLLKRIYEKIKNKKYPQFSKNYPAIDGIATPEIIREGRYSYDTCASKDIRSDIKKILRMNSSNFQNWYKTKKSITNKLLKDLRIIGSIPNLREKIASVGIDKEPSIGGNFSLCNLLEKLEQGLEYLEVIKKIKEDQ